MNVRLVVALEGMLTRAALRELGVPPVVAAAAALLIAFGDIRSALARPALVLAEMIPAALVAWLAAGIFAIAAGGCLFAPLIRFASPATAEERVFHALAALDARTSLAATMVRRLRAIVVPSALLAAAAALTPLDPSVAWAVIALFCSASIGEAGAAVVVSGLQRSRGRRAAAATACSVAALVAAGSVVLLRDREVLLVTAPLLLLIAAVGIAALALVAPHAVSVAPRVARDVTILRGSRLPGFPGGFAPVALVIALHRARPLTLVPGFLVAVVAGCAMVWWCRNAGSPAAIARATVAGAFVPAVWAGFDAAATTRQFAQPLWWMQAKNLDAAVHGTVLGTSLGGFILCGVVAGAAAIAGAPIGVALAAVVFGCSAIIVARSIATLARRRLRSAGIRGGSGLMELLEALAAAPFVAASFALAMATAPSAWVFAGIATALAAARLGTGVVARSVQNEGPGRA